MTEDNVRVHERVMVPIAKIRPNTYNPNVQSPATFNALVDEIRESGWVGEVQLRPLAPEEMESGYEYEIVGGEHRWKAAQVLGMDELPATIHPEWQDDLAKAKAVALNVLQGHLDPVKFTALFNSLSAKYGQDVTKSMMAFTDEALFKRVYRQARQSLPAELRPKLDAASKEVVTMDDLSVILHDLFRKHGQSVDRSYMYFQFGGKTHLMVEMDNDLKKIMKKVTDSSDERQVNVNDVLRDALNRGLA
ncbi:MAG: ParB/RepB/Spo0J family partition protein [Limnohabitans sp.]